MTHIKITKSFYHIHTQNWDTFVFYMEEEISRDNSKIPNFFSFMKLMAHSNVVLKNGTIVKDRFGNMEELLDKALLGK